MKITLKSIKNSKIAQAKEYWYIMVETPGNVTFHQIEAYIGIQILTRHTHTTKVHQEGNDIITTFDNN